MDKGDFIGRAALEKAQANPSKRKLTGFIMKGRGIGRDGYEIQIDGNAAGWVTSGGPSPTTGQNLGLCYVPVDKAGPGNTIHVMVRNQPVEADHEWVSVDGEIGTIGISKYAEQSLGDIVYVDVPKVGASVESGKTLGSVESVKAVSDIYSPVTGEVTAVNEALATAPEKINEDPYELGWLAKIKLSAPDELKALMNAADYAKYLEGFMRYLPKSDFERHEMLQAIGATSLEDLYSYLPKEVRFERPLDIEPGKSEYEIVDYFKARGNETATGYASFLGAGVYAHYRPVIVDTVASRG
ncbi:hypothetical protein Egran_07117, partial [Elaphomyces granulatus]